jgi:hypothetical protein
MSICKKCENEFEPKKGLINYCSLNCRNSRSFSDETIVKKRESNLGQIPWNKGKKINWCVTKCLYCKKNIKHLKSKKRKYHDKCWIKCSGGYRKGSGIGKKGWYKGYWCDSSWELAWIIYNLDYNLPFVRNKKTFSYQWENKIKKYIPDFIQYDNFIEIKGYINKQVNEKIKSVPNLKVLFKKDLKIQFEYVINKYGKNFTDLYEK